MEYIYLAYGVAHFSVPQHTVSAIHAFVEPLSRPHVQHMFKDLEKLLKMESQAYQASGMTCGCVVIISRLGDLIVPYVRIWLPAEHALFDEVPKLRIVSVFAPHCGRVHGHLAAHCIKQGKHHLFAQSCSMRRQHCMCSWSIIPRHEYEQEHERSLVVKTHAWSECGSLRAMHN